MTTEPLVFEFRVRCAPAHAFRTWTERVDAWWPKDHTSTGDPATVVEIEPWEGGRIYERSPRGDENVWGSITVWEPPRRLAFAWWIGSVPGEATDVALTFAADGDDVETTIVRLVHDGWDRLGATGAARRTANRRGWDDLVVAFCSFAA